MGNFFIKKFNILFSIFVLIGLSNSSLGQTGEVFGIICDAKTQKPLTFANIFMNKTTIGAEANEAGAFTIHNVPIGTYEIVGSFIGYTSYRSNIEIKEGEVLHLDIKLNSEAKALDEVNVMPKNRQRVAKELEKIQEYFSWGKTRSESMQDCKPLGIGFRI